jgi:hypothetical protein
MGILVRYALSIGAATAFLAGCGGSQPPIGAPGAMLQIATPQSRSAQRDDNALWMAPQVKHDDLLYISDFYGVHVFSYPKLKLIENLNGVGSSEGLCSDHAGNVFVSDELGADVVEFAHGGTEPIKKFYDISVDFNPYDCSVDPTTNNLAVASADASFVVVFPDEKNEPEAYYDPGAIAGWCAYDDRGNLYLDQVVEPHHRRFEYIGVLKKGTATFKNYLLDRRIAAGGLQFDGHNIVVGNLQTNTLYRLRFAGANATAIGSTPLRLVQHLRQYWIFEGRLIGPDLSGPVYVWKYPAGGSPITSIQAFSLPQGSTISVGS